MHSKYSVYNLTLSTWHCKLS